MKQFITFASRHFTYLFLAIVTLGLTACDSNISGDQPVQENNLAQRASTPEFTTLSQALDAAGLTETLEMDGPFTVFAPTNEAFSKLPEAAIRTLLDPQHKDKLTAILTYHVVPGRVYASDVLELSSAKSAQGTDLSFVQKEGTVYVNNSRVTATDIEATNGVIHVVDTVLLPDWVASWLERSAIAADPLDDVN